MVDEYREFHQIFKHTIHNSYANSMFVLLFSLISGIYRSREEYGQVITDSVMFDFIETPSKCTILTDGIVRER